MANIVVIVLLTGSDRNNLSPSGYKYFEEDSTKTFSKLSDIADRADSSGKWWRYEEHFLNCTNVHEIEDMLRKTYGEVPPYFPVY